MTSQRPLEFPLLNPKHYFDFTYTVAWFGLVRVGLGYSIDDNSLLVL